MFLFLLGFCSRDFDVFHLGNWSMLYDSYDITQTPCDSELDKVEMEIENMYLIVF